MCGADIGSPFLQDTGGTLSNMEGTKCHLLLLLDLLLVSEGVCLGCWRIWNFFTCSGHIQFQSKLNHPSCIKYVLSLMANSRGACSLLHKAACVHSVLTGEPREIFEKQTNKKPQPNKPKLLPHHLPHFSVQKENFYPSYIIHNATSSLDGEK